MEFTYPNNISFECNGCGLCCGDTEQKKRCILLLESEAKEISAKTGLPIEVFAEPVLGKTPYCFEMKKDSEGRCCFLKKSRCSIYESRPLICRFYPFELKFDSDKKMHAFGFTLECPGINKGKSLSKKVFEELFHIAQQRLP